MLQLKGVTFEHKKDCRQILSNFNLVLNTGDKAVIIGEEGNGKSTLLKWIYDCDLIDSYVDWKGEKFFSNEVLAYLPQEMDYMDKKLTVFEYFSKNTQFYYQTPKDLAILARKFRLEKDIFYSGQKLDTLSGGERIKIQLISVLMSKPTILLLDEPSNDIDIETLVILENIINEWKNIVLYVSHDETLIENTANVIVHLEQIKRKTECKYSVVKCKYSQYLENRQCGFDKQMKIASGERREKKIRDQKLLKTYQVVSSSQGRTGNGNNSMTRKMHSIKALQKRYEREDKNMTDIPEQEEAIFLKIGENMADMPRGKVVLDFSESKLKNKDNKILSQNIHLVVRGSEKICIIGKNGCGKTTLLKKIVSELYNRKDLIVEYMSQNYEEILSIEQNPVDYLNNDGSLENSTRIRTYLGAMKYTSDEMQHPMRELSGGQRAKVLLLKISMSNANVLVLDEPTRNFSPLSGPVIRSLLSDFPGTIISVSHDRKYIQQVCDKVYELRKDGLVSKDKNVII